jgi:hypothetical protein
MGASGAVGPAVYKEEIIYGFYWHIRCSKSREFCLFLIIIK